MPEIDKELHGQGYLPVIPTHVYGSASQRPHGFLDAFMHRAKLSKGAFYIKQEDIDQLNAAYPIARQVAAVPNIPRPVEEAPAKKALVVYSDDEKQFFDPGAPCPREEWVPIKEAYLQEASALTKKGCSTCQLNALKRKYKKLLETE